MRAALILIVLLASGCATQARQWDKPGADSETARQDLRDCRKAASLEARRNVLDNNVPRYSLPGAIHPGGRIDPYYQRREPERLGNEMRLASFCMRSKGYELNPTPTDIRPGIRPTSRPQSP